MFTRHPNNPIVMPGGYDWRRAVVFNPGVVEAPDGTIYMLERAAGSLHPFVSQLGLLRSDDGVHFQHVQDTPVFTATELGYPNGGIQDPRAVYLDGQYVLVFVLRKYCANCVPTGVGSPRYVANRYPEQREGELNNSRSGIAVSKDMRTWELVGWVAGEEVDDRDNILFPEKVGGKYVMLRRPMEYVGPAYGTTGPGIWISTSEDLKAWSEPTLIAGPTYPWEGKKIGGSTPPLRTDAGWLVTYHGVDQSWAYCMGMMLLDLDDPTKVLARTPEPVFRPETYYERFGLVIPNVVFPNSNIVREGTVYLYYGACDTAICLATAPLQRLVDHLLSPACRL